jgi:peptide deformylase
MRETLADAPGVGLAAPQIGESLQLVIIEDKPGISSELDASRSRGAGSRPVPFHVLINPGIELLSSSDVSFFEGPNCITR